MDISLTPRIEQLISERLAGGRYSSAVEVVEDAFNALAEREAILTIRAELDHADEQLVRGEYTEFDPGTIQELAERIKSRGQARLQEEKRG